MALHNVWVAINDEDMIRADGIKRVRRVGDNLDCLEVDWTDGATTQSLTLVSRGATEHFEVALVAAIDIAGRDDDTKVVFLAGSGRHWSWSIEAASSILERSEHRIGRV